VSNFLDFFRVRPVISATSEGGFAPAATTPKPSAFLDKAALSLTAGTGAGAAVVPFLTAVLPGPGFVAWAAIYAAVFVAIVLVIEFGTNASSYPGRLLKVGAVGLGLLNGLILAAAVAGINSTVAAAIAATTTP
jgi:hypothetical protein